MQHEEIEGSGTTTSGAPTLTSEGPLASDLLSASGACRSIAQIAHRMSTGVASQDAQVMLYGEERWHRNFRFVRDINDIPGKLITGDKLKLHVWNSFIKFSDELCRAPQSDRHPLADSLARFIKLQQTFCDPNDFIVPKFTVQKGGVLHFELPESPLDLSTLAMIFSPARITGKLLIDLGIIDKSNESKTETQLMEDRSSLANIAELKVLIDAAQSFHPRRNRVLTIGKPTPEQITQNPIDVKGPSAHMMGAVLVISGKEGKTTKAKEEPRFDISVKTAAISPFIDSRPALRQRSHIMDGYLAERARISRLRAELFDKKNAVDSAWKPNISTERKDQLKEQAQTIIDETIDFLENCKDPYKKKAVDTLTRVRDFRDSLERENVSTTLNGIAVAIAELERRGAVTIRKSEAIWRDYISLNKHTEDSKNALGVFGRKVLEVARLSLGRRSHSTDDQQSFQVTYPGDKTFTRLMEEALRRTDLRFSPIELPKVQPFNLYSTVISTHSARFNAAYDTKNVGAMRRELVTLHLVCNKIMRADQLVDQIDAQLSEVQEPNYEKMLEQIKAAGKYFVAKQVYGQTIVPGMRTVYEEIRGDLRDLYKRIAEFNKQAKDGTPPDEKAKDELKSRIKSYAFCQKALRLSNDIVTANSLI